MENFPYHIETDEDLRSYENYANENGLSRMNEMSTDINMPPMQRQRDNMSLIPQENRNLPKSLKNTAYLPSFLAKHIGKLIKVESLIGGNLESRIGILMTVGANYIVLRQMRSNNTMICDSTLIKYATIIHDNDIKKLIP